jgi:putative PEP-CTERM system TPR-repeat lipoprotein
MRLKQTSRSRSSLAFALSFDAVRPALISGLIASLCALSPIAWATPEKAAKFYEDALQRFEKGDLDGATIQLKNTIQQDQKMLAAHLLLGKVLMSNGEWKGAEAAFEEALKQGVSRSEVAVPLGQIWLQLGERKRLLEQLNVNGMPQSIHADILTLRGSAYAMAGNVAMASKSFSEAKQANPNSASPLIAEASLLLRQGDLDKAKASATKATELAPKQPAAWYTLGTILQVQKDVKGALAAQERALTLSPKQVDSRVAHASLLISLGRETEAAKDLEFLAQEGLKDPRASYLTGLLAARKGDELAAKSAFGDAAGLVDALPPDSIAGNEPLLMVGGLSHRALGNAEKAQGYLETLLGSNSKHYNATVLLAGVYLDRRDYNRAAPLLEAAIRANPDDPQVLYLMGSLNMARKRYQAASELFEKAAAKSGTASAVRELGFSQLGLGQDKAGIANLEKAFAAKPGDARSGVQLTMTYLAQGNSAKALQTVQSIVKKDPSNLTMLSFLGNIKGRTGDKRGAREAFTQALSKDPNFRPAAINLSWLDMEELRFDEARSRLSKMVVGGRDDPDILFQLGVLELRAKRLDEAMANLKKAEELQRTDPRAGLLMVDLLQSQQQNDKALSTAKSLAAKYSSVLAPQLALARLYLGAGDPNNARLTLQAATRIAEFNPAQQVQIGRMNLMAGGIDGAAYNVQKALQAQPNYLDALGLQVEVEARRGDAGRVDAAMKTLSSAYPGNTLTLMTGAHIAMSRGQFAAALAGYRAVMAKEPSTANAILVTQAHIAAGNSDKALAELEAWSKKNPKDRNALKAVAQVQTQAGKLEAARKSFAQILALEPNDPTTLIIYASLLQRLNDPAAVEAAEKAVRFAPGNAEAIDNLGWILVQRGKVDIGLRHLRDARLRNPASGSIRFHLAYALAKSGRKAEAKEELTAALNSPNKLPTTPELTQLKADLGL